MKILHSVAVLCLAAASLLLIGHSTGFAQSVGLQAVERFVDYPIIPTDVQAHYVSSYDRSGGNDDGFQGTFSALYVDTNGEHVIFDAKGPGCLYTLWFTSREDGWSPLGWGRIRFYFDDESAPRLDLDAAEFFGGQHRPFTAPLVFNPFESTGGYVSYVPFPFQKRLKITTEERVGFYNAYYHTYSPDRLVSSWTGKEDFSKVVQLWSQPGMDPKPEQGVEKRSGIVAPAAAGEAASTSLLLELPEAGTITSIRINPLFPLTPYQLNHVSLRIYWDGETTPSVDAPLGIFFGSGLGEASVRAIAVGMSPSSAYYCYLPMPFWRKARVELANDNPTALPKVWWEVGYKPASLSAYPSEISGYFKTQYRKEWPTRLGRDYQILETSGRGVLVGQVMTVEPLRAENKRWWEGDLRLYLDGRRHPAFHGTGHEDEYLGGWSNEWLMNPYSLPMHGEPVTRDLSQIDFQWNASTSVYRFFVGGVPFQSQIALSTEHGVDNGATAFYSSLAYYYHRPDPAHRVDTLDVGSFEDERRHSYEAEGASPVVHNRFQFEGVGSYLEDDGREVSGRSRFVLTVPSNSQNRGLRLRRLYDQKTAQEAEVWIDGRLVGVWYSPATNVHRRWAETDFQLPAGLTKGKPRLGIELRVVGHWNEYRYELWSLP
ncbi:MAG: glycoside hydrolase family 172 protein [Acidobacteriota bacterium]